MYLASNVIIEISDYNQWGSWMAQSVEIIEVNDCNSWGSWMAQLVEGPLLVSAQVTVCGFRPHSRFCADSVELAWDLLSLSLSFCPSPVISVSKQIKKLKKNFF